LQLGSEDVLAGERPAELLDVFRIHTFEPGILLEPRRAEGRDAYIANRTHDTIG
jgi:hypothetical protein